MSLIDWLIVLIRLHLLLECFTPDVIFAVLLIFCRTNLRTLCNLYGDVANALSIISLVAMLKFIIKPVC